MAADLDMDADDQDVAEIFDEDNITEDGGDIATSDMERDLFDVTSAADDADDDTFGDEDDDDFDPDQADEAELELMLEEDDGVDAEDQNRRDPGDLVFETDATPAMFEGGRSSGDDEENDDMDVTNENDPTPEGPPATHTDPHTEKELDHGIEETFPASDPVSISPGAD